MVSPLRARLTPERAEELTLCGVWLKTELGQDFCKPANMARRRVHYGPYYAHAPDDPVDADAIPAAAECEEEERAMQSQQMDAAEG